MVYQTEIKLKKKSDNKISRIEMSLRKSIAWHKHCICRNRLLGIPPPYFLNA